MYSTLEQMNPSTDTIRDKKSKLQNLVSNTQLQNLVSAYGLKIQNVSWEDTARNKNSCWGPNITDMTLYCNGNMPVIRKPNFSDVTCDVDPNKFHVTVGNENNGTLTRISLIDYIKNITKYTELKITGSLLSDRDTAILASSQACLLPLDNGEIEFNVQMYNYQSTTDDSACLTIVASEMGTSAQILNSGTQKLYFQNGKTKTNFTATRLEDDRKKRGVTETGVMSSNEQERNVLMIFQIPLKTKRTVPTYGYPEVICNEVHLVQQALPASFGIPRATAYRGMDHAMLGVGKSTGDWTTANQYIERDTRYPIRLTLQYYRVTDEDIISEDHIKEISQQLSKIYTSAEVTGSLVLNSNTNRVTEPILKCKDTAYLMDKPLFSF